jgi:hypothetical protein
MVVEPRWAAEWPPVAGVEGEDMSKHERQDDKDKYTGNGYKPGPIPTEDRGGKHGKPDDIDDQDEQDDKDEGK